MPQRRDKSWRLLLRECGELPPPTSDTRVVVRFLLERGHLTANEVFSESFIIEQCSGRNALVLFKTPRQTLALKRFHSRESLVRETAALELLHGAGKASNHPLDNPTERTPFSVPLPVQSGPGLLLTRTAPGLKHIGSEHISRRDDRSIVTETVAKRIAGALAALHAMELPPDVSPAPHPIELAGVGPWILDVPQPVRDLIALLQQSAVTDALAGLKEGLRSETGVFVHGDIRTGNVLSGSKGLLWLIDWETAGSGPPTLDVAALVAVLAEIAVIRGKGPPDPRLVTSTINTYARARGIRVDVVLTTRAAGARLLQSAVERAHREFEVSPHTLACFTLGRFLLLRPLDGAVRMGLLA